jgi:hypothetical protein
MPGFNAAAALGPTIGRYPGNRVFVRFPSEGSGGIVPQRLGFGGDPDLGEYLRCRANGGGELICRFFAGLPPFTIGGRLI